MVLKCCPRSSREAEQRVLRQPARRTRQRRNSWMMKVASRTYIQPVWVSLLCLAVMMPVRSRADEQTLGLTRAQVLKMTSDQWLAYYYHKTHTNGARSTYKALVIYTNLLQEQDERDLARLSQP